MDCSHLGLTLVRYLNPQLPILGMDGRNRYPVDVDSLLLGAPVLLPNGDVGERGLVRHLGGDAWSEAGYRPNDAELFPVVDRAHGPVVAQALTFRLWDRPHVFNWLYDRQYSPRRAALWALRDLSPKEDDLLRENVRLTEEEILLFRVMVDHIVRIQLAVEDMTTKLL